MRVLDLQMACRNSQGANARTARTLLEGLPDMREAVGIFRDYEETAALPIANPTNNLELMIEALRRC